jgi:hypothetical protein
MNSLPERENHSASLDSRSEENMSDMLPPEQPAIIGASRSNASSGFRLT